MRDIFLVLLLVQNISEKCFEILSTFFYLKEDNFKKAKRRVAREVNGKEKDGMKREDEKERKSLIFNFSESDERMVLKMVRS